MQAACSLPKMYNYFFCCCILLLLSVQKSFQYEERLNVKLKRWEVIDSAEDVIQSNFVHHRTTRSIDNDKIHNYQVEKKVSLNLQRNTIIEMWLYPFSSLLSPDFSIEIHDNNVKSSLVIDKNSLFEGLVEGVANSTVVASFGGSTRLTNARIALNADDAYIVEPLWRHVPNQVESRDKLLVYKLSDMEKHSSSNFCGNEKINNETQREMSPTSPSKSDNSNSYDEDEVKQRTKRSSSAKRVCRLKLTADHKFYKKYSRGNDAEIVYYLLNHIAQVNTIFKSTVWGQVDGMRGRGTGGYHFQVDEIEIFRSPTRSFNSAQYIGPSNLLRAYSYTKNKQCLAHLFTYRSFSDGVLGLAYVAEPGQRNGFGGGICSYPLPIFINPRYYNVGMTSFCSFGESLLSAKAVLVTAHELGHNFGSYHDDEPSSCAPGQSGGGNYLMYAGAVTGFLHNNLKFSQCSKRNVNKVLKSSSSQCFVVEKQDYCGDYKIDVKLNEECDSGKTFAGLAKVDKCCTSQCKLRAGAVCSPFNHLCCDNDCTVSDASKVCHSYVPGLCEQTTYCNGVDRTCPTINLLPDGSPCGDRGLCLNGKCQSFCETKGLKECFCKSEVLRCYQCCAPKLPGGGFSMSQCAPYKLEDGNRISLDENARCIYGYCQEGICVKTTQDFIERVGFLLDEIQQNGLAVFMADNLVGSIAFLSLLLWIPLSILVDYVDRKTKKYREEEFERYLDELDKRLPHWGIESDHGFDLIKITSENTIRRNKETDYLKSHLNLIDEDSNSEFDGSEATDDTAVSGKAILKTVRF